MLIMEGKVVTRTRDFFQNVGDLIRDLDCQWKATNRGNRSGKKVTQGFGRRPSTEDEDIFILRGVIAHMTDEMRVLRR